MAMPQKHMAQVLFLVMTSCYSEECYLLWNTMSAHKTQCSRPTDNLMMVREQARVQAQVQVVRVSSRVEGIWECGIVLSHHRHRPNQDRCL
ncbi:hypothetical protein FR483_n260R [Paramecium bursaria Chlorella virus FR483]|uniref:Uncharacterized protein n260R n=1 Tax=Paramecium bursaria Chlorella virus FR483 TaxID=399781 RepID=A7J6W4_PBCVF|nr:hypothetical protein FR483_n260R [Paramecium bursaria Chlorella virus FR483]ABT15545.1 hypothetical protein FR483_n260R [Paramecium bursaria Chlorella virus FR483]